MKIVAEHLQQQAISRPAPERDFFGRSAFNRYYYATYLIVKDSFSHLNKDWSVNLPHAQTAEMLRGAITKQLKAGKNKAAKVGDGELINTCSRAIAAAEDLAKIMEQGRAARVVADYEPDKKIDFYDNNFSLNKVSVTEAQSWPHRAYAFLQSIEEAWINVNDK